MDNHQQLLDQLQAYEKEYTSYRDLFLEDGGIQDQDQDQLDRIERMIHVIREYLAEHNGEAGDAREAPSAASTDSGAGSSTDDDSVGSASSADQPEEVASADAATAGPAGAPDRRKEFQKARRSWQAVKERAIQDLEAVKDGIRDYYLDDPEQFQLADSKLTRLDEIMDNLNDDLRDVLDRYVSTPLNKQAQLESLGDEARSVVQKFLDYASTDKLLNAVDQKEFADVTVKAPVEKSLKDLLKTLA